MSQALHLVTGIVSLIGTAPLGFNTADTIAAAGTLTLGAANATAVNVGTHANAATVSVGGPGVTLMNIGAGAAAAATLNIGTTMGAGGAVNIGTAGQMTTVLGNFTVNGTEHVIGGTTFDSNVTLGDATADSILVKGTLSFDAVTPGYVSGDIPFSPNGNHSLAIKDSTTGGNLTLAAGTHTAGAGGDLFLTPGTGSTVTGSLRFGKKGGTAVGDFQLLAYTNVATEAGIRYNPSTDIWELRSDGAGSWSPINVGAAIPAGTLTRDILQWNGSAWISTSLSQLMATSDTYISPADGNNQRIISILGQSALAANTAGGAVFFGGGPSHGTAPGADTYIYGGPNVEAVAGAGGNTHINAGTGFTSGNVYLADDAQGATLNVFLGAGTNGIKFVTGTGVLSAIGTGAINLVTTTSTNFQFNGTAVAHHANMTAANFATLFNGGNASTLHTHAGLAASSVDVPVAVDGGAVNDLVYIAAADTITTAVASSLVAARAAGVKTAAGTVRVAGVATVQIEGVLVVAAGDDLYLSATSAGDVTNVAPSTSGQFVTYIGQAKTGATGPATITAYLRCERPIAL